MTLSNPVADVLPTIQQTPGLGWQRWWYLVPALVVVNLFIVWLAVTVGVGSVTLDVGQIWRALSDPEAASRLEIVAVNARLPRALMAVGVGFALGIAGALLQALYRNPLADPGVTGVTQGAVVAAVLWIVFGPPSSPGEISWILPGISALGACLSGGLTWLVAQLSGKVEPIRLILIGILIGGVLSAFTSLSLLLAGDSTQTLIAWLSGSLAMVTWQRLQLLAIAFFLIAPLVLMAIPRANLLHFGDDVTAGLGQSPTAARAIVLLAACTLTAAAVCTTGGIGFVGLIAPHLVRWYVGSDLRRLAPVAGLTGALLVGLADLAARNLQPVAIQPWLNIPVQATTLPVGVYLALLGGPFFLFVLRKIKA